VAEAGGGVDDVMREVFAAKSLFSSAHSDRGSAEVRGKEGVTKARPAILQVCINAAFLPPPVSSMPLRKRSCERPHTYQNDMQLGR